MPAAQPPPETPQPAPCKPTQANDAAGTFLSASADAACGFGAGPLSLALPEGFLAGFSLDSSPLGGSAPQRGCGTCVEVKCTGSVGQLWGCDVAQPGRLTLFQDLPPLRAQVHLVPRFPPSQPRPARDPRICPPCPTPKTPTPQTSAPHRPQSCVDSNPVTVMLYDNCGGCAQGGLNLHAAAFAKIAPLSLGRVPIAYHQVSGGRRRMARTDPTGPFPSRLPCSTAPLPKPRPHPQTQPTPSLPPPTPAQRSPAPPRVTSLSWSMTCGRLAAATRGSPSRTSRAGRSPRWRSRRCARGVGLGC
jgi:hypothetical protein